MLHIYSQFWEILLVGGSTLSYEEKYIFLLHRDIWFKPARSEVMVEHLWEKRRSHQSRTAGTLHRTIPVSWTYVMTIGDPAENRQSGVSHLCG
jgi:hypothetical protein